jgi:Holliday junction resolvasome RuvABC endonuclease subunit
VQRAITRELRVAERLAPDAADALAIALCHLESVRMTTLLAAAERAR